MRCARRGLLGSAVFPPQISGTGGPAITMINKSAAQLLEPSADFVEPDAQKRRDGVSQISHENRRDEQLLPPARHGKGAGGGRPADARVGRKQQFAQLVEVGRRAWTPRGGRGEREGYQG